jgi:hypothetical protein
MKARILNIEDGELLHYGTYQSGEKVDNTYNYIKINSNKNLLNIYSHSIKPGSKSILPENFTDYSANYEISLERASISSILFKNPERNLKDFKGISEVDFKIDFTNNLAILNLKTRDGAEEKASNSKIRIKPGYPVWDSDSIMYIGSRFLDFDSGGIVYALYPLLVKEPIPGYAKLITKEVIETKAGKFNTIKYGFSISDPFLGRLLDTYVKNFFIWIEDSPRRLMVKIQSGGDDMEFILEDIVRG